MVAVDTTVLLRIIIRDDALQSTAADRFIESTAWVPAIALLDAIWLLRKTYKLGPQEIAKAIEMLLSHKHLVVQDAETIAAALDLFRLRPALGFADCVILESARKAGHRLGTFDRRLGKIDGAEPL